MRLMSESATAQFRIFFNSIRLDQRNVDQMRSMALMRKDWNCRVRKQSWSKRSEIGMQRLFAKNFWGMNDGVN
jgi:hypothetical protein